MNFLNPFMRTFKWVDEKKSSLVMRTLSWVDEIFPIDMRTLKWVDET
jgi:hypothetical protein